MKTITKYVSDDGKEFDTEEACAEHEKNMAIAAARKDPARVISGCTFEECQALARGEIPDGTQDLAEAIERMARLIRNGRYARGEFKASRRGRAASEEPEAPTPPSPEFNPNEAA